MSVPSAWGGNGPNVLASDEAREHTVEVLKGGYLDGRLTQEEYEHRIGIAYQARTHGELGALTSDLPRPYMPPPPGTNGKAVAALVCGVAGLFTGLSAIPAVVLGHMARREIRRTREQGDAMAVTGLVLGYVITVAMLLALVGVILLVVAFAQDAHGTF
jgi:uncharacterized membrane protein